ncbi:hypothetical protein ALC57_06128 [Trachymyrmex cornetzi]|uniref:Uncharacterized protein n=1 Tax=Trachymyrmex cornetzi TaxID=471704 RepID=A0A195E9M0_9HYME|nr:hypothetical protein ALC57_06128 [Trachymyrmex cornetzi]
MKTVFYVKLEKRNTVDHQSGLRQFPRANSRCARYLIENLSCPRSTTNWNWLAHLGLRPFASVKSGYNYAHAKIPDRNFAIALRGTRRKLMEMDVIPADRRPPEKEETWTLAADQQDSCVCFDGAVDSKVKDAHNSEKTQLKPPAEVISVDAGDNVDNTLPRSQETRKSKTKKVKSYLKKCKGALSKGDENVADKRRQENCTSWYLDDVPTCVSQQEDHDEPPEKYTEFPEERLKEAVRDVESVEDPVPETLEENFSRGENLEEIPHDALTRLLEEDRRADLSRSRTSLYEDIKDGNPEQPVSDEKTPTKESELFRDEEKQDAAISLETLTTEDTNLNKCDSSDTLIAEVPEATEIATDLNSELTIIVKEEEEDAPKDPADEEILVPVCCGRDPVLLAGELTRLAEVPWVRASLFHLSLDERQRSLEAVYSGAPRVSTKCSEHPVYLCSITFTSDYRLNRTSSVDAQKTISGEYGAGFIVIGGNDGFTPPPPPPPPTTTILFS